MKDLEIDIHVPSCKACGVGSDEFEKALKSELNEKYALKVFITAYPPNSHFQEGCSRLGLSNSGEGELNEVTNRVINIFRGLIGSEVKIT